MEPNNSQGKDLSVVIKDIIKDNYKWVLGILSPISIFLCFTTLWIYTRYIGRPDAFGESFEVTPQTLLMPIAAFLSLLGLLIVLFLPSYFLIQGRLGLKVNGVNRKHVIRWLTAIVTANITCFFILIVLITVDFWSPKWPSLWLIPGLIISIVMTSVFAIRNKNATIGLFSSVLVVSGSLFISATISTFSFLLISSTYKDTGGFSLAIFLLQWLSIMLLSLAPAISYLLAEEDSTLGRIKKVLIGIALGTTLITTVTPSLLGNFSLGAIRIARLIDNHPKYYQVFQKDYDVDNLVQKEWSIDNIKNDSYRIIATSLYSFGSKTLLCPKELAKITPANFHLYTHRCILFDKSSVKPLNRAI